MDTLLNEYLIEQMYNLSDREVSYIIKYYVQVLAIPPKKVFLLVCLFPKIGQLKGRQRLLSKTGGGCLL